MHLFFEQIEGRNFCFSPCRHCKNSQLFFSHFIAYIKYGVDLYLVDVALSGRETKYKIDMDLATAYVLDEWSKSIRDAGESGERKLINPVDSSGSYELDKVISQLIGKIKANNSIFDYSECYKEELAPFREAYARRIKEDAKQQKKQKIRSGCLYALIWLAVILVAILFKALFD